MAEEEHGSDELELTLEEARLIAGLRRRAARELRESAARAAVPLSPRSHAVADELGVSPTTARNIANCRDDEKRDYPILAEHEAQQFRLAARRCPLFIAVEEDLRLYEINKVVWDTGQQAHMGKIARVNQERVYQSAFFGWCMNFRGTNAEVDATSFEDYSSQAMVGHGGQCKLEHRAGQRLHHHQGGGHGGLHQQEARHGHLQQQGGHHPLL